MVESARKANISLAQALPLDVSFRARRRWAMAGGIWPIAIRARAEWQWDSAKIFMMDSVG